MRLGVLVALLALLFTGACATTATGTQTSALAVPTDVAVFLDKQPKTSDTLVVLRYPSVVSAEARDQFNRAFIDRSIGGSLRGTDVNSADAERVATSLIAKTNYFVMSLYANLKETLPRDSVLLSPHLVTLDDLGRLTSEPLMGPETLPTVLTVDFTPYSFPDFNQMMAAPPLTFGDIITPLVVVHADHRAKPETFGVMLASAPLAGVAYNEARAAALRELQDVADGVVVDRPGRRLDFIALLDAGARPAPATQPLTLGSDEGAIQVLPVQKLRLPTGAMSQMVFEPGKQIDPLERRFSDHLATRIIDILNTMDYDRATFAARMQALARYDAEVADLYLAGDSNEDVERRLAFTDKLLQAERRFASKQSEALYAGTFEGERGAQMRQIIGAEWEALEERRALARQQNVATGIAVLAAAAAIYAGTQGDGDFGSQLGTQVAIAAAGVAAFRALDASSRSRTIGENVLISLAPALEDQVVVQVEFLDGAEEITASSFGEFRDQMIQLYDTRIGEIDTVAETCSFANGGRWTGECENGLAHGQGRGIYNDAEGRLVEYIGEARGGLADGVGYMVAVSNSGTLAWEGQFAGGQPHGAVTLHEAGSAPAARQFDAGVPGARVGEAPTLFEQPDVTKPLEEEGWRPVPAAGEISS